MVNKHNLTATENMKAAKSKQMNYGSNAWCFHSSFNLKNPFVVPTIGMIQTSNNNSSLDSNLENDTYEKENGVCVEKNILLIFF